MHRYISQQIGSNQRDQSIYGISGVVEEYSAQQDLEVTEKREEKKEEKIKDKPPSTHLIFVEVERVMSRVGRCD